jgi:DNA-binding transcriptional LysR family regulator
VALRRGEIDVGLVGQEAAVLTREFYWRRIARLPLVVAVPENHRLAEQNEVRMTELRDEMFIGAAERAVRDAIVGSRRFAAAPGSSPVLFATERLSLIRSRSL